MIFLTLLLNFWILEIFKQDFLIAVLLTITSLTLYYVNISKKITALFLISFILLNFLQIQTTNFKPLNYLSPIEQYIQVTRSNQYPNYYSLPLAHNLEQRQIWTILGNLQENLFLTLDPNLHFFGGHPNEGTYTHHLKEFPFIYLPLLIIGLMTITIRKDKILLGSLIVSMILISIIGGQNPSGLLILFPMMVVLISRGLLRLFKK